MSKIFVDEIAGIASADTVAIPGHVIQVVRGSASSEVLINTSSYTDTGLSAIITPTSTSSKILVLVEQSLVTGRAAADALGGLRILRNDTAVYTTRTAEFGISVTGSSGCGLYMRIPLTYEDSPSSTSALTYKTQGVPYLTDNNGNIQVQDNSESTSFITLMEIAG